MKGLALPLLVLMFLYQHAHSRGSGCTDRHTGKVFKDGDKWLSRGSQGCYRCHCSRMKKVIKVCEITSVTDDREDIYMEKYSKSALALLTHGLQCVNAVGNGLYQPGWSGRAVRKIRVIKLGRFSYWCNGGFYPVFLNEECYSRFNRTRCEHDVFNSTTHGECRGMRTYSSIGDL